MERTIGVYGGSFNPVHTGHLLVASYIAQWTGIDEVWLMLSPLNPFKADSSMAPTDHRLAMLSLAVEPTPWLKVSTVQLTMPVPSYTIDALDLLAREYPHCRFKCVIGSDSWERFGEWRQADRILSDYGVVIYPRPGYPIDPADLPKGVEIAAAPTVDISSTFVRRGIAEGKNMSYFVPTAVYDYIVKHNLYTH